MIVVTTQEIPGCAIIGVLGAVIGVTARTRNPFVEGLKQPSGEANPATLPATLAMWRNDAVLNMISNARTRGANAIVDLRFDHREVSESTVEICAYGTAVIVTIIQPPRLQTEADAHSVPPTIG